MARVLRVAVVTGANRGVGFGIVRVLCKQFDGDVILTSRDEALGKAAIEELQKENLNPKYHQLDITDSASLQRLKCHLSEIYGGLDVLVNNAATAYPRTSEVPAYEQGVETFKLNLWATLDCCETLLPIVKDHARVVNVSSINCITARDKSSQQIQQELRSCKNKEDIQNLISRYMGDLKAGVEEEKGWPHTKYGIGKYALNIMTEYYQQEVDRNSSKTDVIVNACCPGSVKTRLNRNGKLTLDEGAVLPVYLALLPINTTSPRGEFLSDGKIVQWR